MANVTVTTTDANVTVSSTNSNIAVSQVTSNVVVGETTPVTIPTSIVTNSGKFAVLSVGDSVTTQYTFPIDSPAIDQGLRAHANGTLYWSADVGLVDSVNGQTGTVVLTTSNIAEGTNTYFTDARARASISATSPALYDSATGVISISSSALFTGKTTDDLTEGSNNLYYTQGRFDSALSAKSTSDIAEGTNLYYTTARQNTDFDTRLATKTTSDVAEGTNLYYTDTRVDSRLSSGSISTPIKTTNVIETNTINPISGTVVTVNGALEVNGNLNVVEKVDLLLQDNKIVLNYGNATARDAYITVDRSGSTLANANISWNEADDRFIFSDHTKFDDNIRVTAKSSADPKIIFNKTAAGADIFLKTTSASIGPGLFTNETGLTLRNESTTDGTGGLIVTQGASSTLPAVLYNHSSDTWTISTTGDTVARKIPQEGTAASFTTVTAANVSVSNTLFVDTIDNKTGSNVTLNANVIIGTNPAGTVTANVYASTAITAIISSLNSGNAADLVTLSGHGSQIFADGTYIEISGIIDSGATEINTDSPYYTKWNNAEAGYNLYVDSGLLTPAHPATTGFYLGAPAGTPVAKNVTGTSSTTVFGPANVYAQQANIHSGRVINGGDITTATVTASGAITADTLSTTGNISTAGYLNVDDGVLPTTLSNRVMIGGNDILLTQTQLEGDSVSGAGIQLGSGVAQWGQLAYQGLQATSLNSPPTYNNVTNFKPPYIVGCTTTAGSNSASVTAILKQVNYFNNPGGSMDTDPTNISTYMANEMFVGMALSSELEPLGRYGECNWNAGLVTITSIDSVNRTFTTSQNAARTQTGSGAVAYNGTSPTISSAFYNTNIGLAILPISQVDSQTGSAQNIVGIDPNTGNPTIYITTTGSLGANQLFDIDDFTLSTDLTRSDWTDTSTTAQPLFTGRNYWTIDKNPNDTTKTSPIFRAQDGIVIGASTELGNRPFADTFNVNGMNIGWDGLQSSIGNKARNPATQIALGQHKNFSSTLSNANWSALNGPRLLLSSFEGDTNTAISKQFPRADTEIGRVMGWGRSEQIVSPSTFNPSAKLSFWAKDFSSTNTKTTVALINNDGPNGAKFIAVPQHENEGALTAVQGTNQVVLAPVSNGGFAQTDTAAHNRPSAQKWAKASYVNESARTGSKFVVTSGHNSLKTPDLEFGIERKTSLNQITLKTNRGGTNYFTDNNATPIGLTHFYSANSIGYPGDGIRLTNNSETDSFPEDWTDGLAVTLNNFTGAFGTAVNGNTYYARKAFNIIMVLYTDAAMTTGLSTGVAFGTDVDTNNNADMTILASGRSSTYSNNGGRADKKYTWHLPNNSDDVIYYEDLVNGSGGTELYRYNSTTAAFDYSKPINSTQSITASSFIGNVTGDTAGTHTGPVTGNLTGDSAGTHTGPVSGNVTGDTAGTHTGAVIGNVTGDLTGAVTGTVSSLSNHNTNALNEGSTNLYYTTARQNTDFDTRFNTKTTSNLAEGTNLYYTSGRFNTAFAGKNTTDLTEGTNLYYTNARADARVNLQTGTNLDLSNKTTSDVTEGTNLYYTDARVDSRLSSGSVASISADETTLKKFNETKVDLGSVSGDQSSAIDLDNGSIYTATLNGNLTLNSLANGVAGASGMIIITQDGTGSRTITTGSNIKWSGGLNTLSTGAGSIDIINFMYDGTTYYFSLTKGYEAQ